MTDLRPLSLYFNQWIPYSFVQLACEQALWGALAAGQEKEGDVATTSLEFEYLCIKKVDAKCWLRKMTLVMTSLPLARAFTCLFNVCLHSRSLPHRADWPKSDSSFNGEPQGNWRWNSNSRDVVASSPSFSRPAARAPRRACSVYLKPA